jgi:hypothetical protein
MHIFSLMKIFVKKVCLVFLQEQLDLKIEEIVNIFQTLTFAFQSFFFNLRE